MSESKGCLKNGCLGCLGVLVLGFVFLGVNAVMVMNRGDSEPIEDRVLSSDTVAATEPIAKSKVAPAAGDKPAAGRGWLILELAQGEFQLHPGEPGTGVTVKASYDASIFELEEYSHIWPDSAWVYHVRFHRTITGLQAILHEIMGGSEGARLHIYIPPDLPVELNILVKEGGLEAELGGLWLTDLDLRFDRGGVTLSVNEPLREPLENLVIHGRMGGGEISGLGNASPALLDVSCFMAGMALDLKGAWSRDCDARLSLSMGGMELLVPDNIELENVDQAGSGLRRADGEIDRPLLRLQQQVKMGEIEIR